jgi:outer membrane protein TolC
VLGSYWDLVLMEEKIRIQRENVDLLQLLSSTAANRVQAGAPQQDLLKAQIAHRLAENELEAMVAEHHGMVAMLNGMLAREPYEAIPLPAAVPEPRPLATDDATLLKAASESHPALAALGRDVSARQGALELARMQYLPDINPTAAFTGSVSQALGAMVSIPINHAAIRAMVDEQRQMLRGAEAMARQKRSERAAQLVAALVAMRNNERQVALLRDRVLPAAHQALASSRQSYAAGTVSFADLIDSQRTLLDVRVMAAEARASREKRLAEVEALAGFDVEMLGNSKSESSDLKSDRAVTP